jgi:hypothetical protein
LCQEKSGNPALETNFSVKNQQNGNSWKRAVRKEKHFYSTPQLLKGAAMTS